MSSASPKSILKQNSIHTNASSWFSKFNNETNTTTTPPISPRLNSLFSTFRKQPVSTQPVEKEDTILEELTPKELKRVRFPVSDLTKEYQFKKDDLVEQKKEVVVEPLNIQTCSQLLSLYEVVCRKKQEKTMDRIVMTLSSQPHATFLTRLDLTNQAINRNTIDPLLDMMGIDFGIRELVLTNCGLEDNAIKILMHSLLSNDKITHISLANNPKISTQGFKYIAVYIKGSTQLVHMDLSHTQPDKKSIQYISSATLQTESNKPSLEILLLNDCGLRNTHIEVLAAGMRKLSSIRHLYLRGNRFVNGGALSIGVMLRDYDNQDSLKGLYLDNNDLSHGVQYIAQALRRNQSLLTLSMCDCKIDAKGCVLIGEALKYNQRLERCDIGYNLICVPDLEGVNLLRQALNLNRTLKDLRLSDTDLSTEAAIVLSECLPQNNAIIRLDMSRNPRIDLAGLTALSAAIRMNQTLTFIDINIPKDDKDMVQLHNDILATCTRNATQSKTNPKPDVVNTPVTATQATARLTLQERLAAATRGSTSKPVETKKQDPVNPEDALLIQQAFECVGLLEDIIESKDGTSEKADGVFLYCKQVQSNICKRIPSVSDASQLDILLSINDRLTNAIQKFELIHVSVVMEAPEAIDIVQHPPEPEQPSSSFEIGDDESDEEEEEENHLEKLRNEIEAEESAAFLKAKKIELDVVAQ